MYISIGKIVFSFSLTILFSFQGISQIKPFRTLYDSTSQLTIYLYQKTDTVFQKKTKQKIVQSDTLCTYSSPETSQQRLLGVHMRYTYGAKTLHGICNLPLLIQTSLFKKEIDTLEKKDNFFQTQKPYTIPTITDIQLWQFFLKPISDCEGGLFRGLNTYDPVGFSFGFLQFAANGRGKDSAFAEYFRQVLISPKGHALFPNLTITDKYRQFRDTVSRRMYRTSDFMPRPNEARPHPLRQLLNPDSSRIDDKELINAAKFLYLVDSDTSFRTIQVRLAIKWAKQILNSYWSKSQEAGFSALDINGQSFKVCIVLVDLIHHGRARFEDIQKVLSQPQADEQTMINKLLALDTNGSGKRAKELKLALQKLNMPAITGLVCIRKEGDWVFEKKK
ncbi:hypothetical protein QNI19_16080 [Cytophagaceae bacterium DM2B3-1]|uniref:Uncharacterized protein n=1 Tax=Xanthocytophaga flava TaxID=3048013 RepID=A0ABT7CL43_9BACT|nr:hypothetical protein [Xanthocytophaga flavus]MDJ1494464.1 hypothetical protein [Xanthocytophaga flavus]